MISGSFIIEKVFQIGTNIRNYICDRSDKSNAKQILTNDISKQPKTRNRKLNERQLTIWNNLYYIGCATALGTVVTRSILKLSIPLTFTASTIMAGFFIISNLILKNRREAKSPTNSYKGYKGVAFKSSITDCNKIEFTKGNPENTNTLIIKEQIPHKKGKQKTNFYCNINDGRNSKFTNISSINNTGRIAKKDENFEDDLTQNCEDNYAQKINKNFAIKEENLDKSKIVPSRGKFYFKDIVISEPIKNSPTKIDSESIQNMAIIGNDSVSTSELVDTCDFKQEAHSADHIKGSINEVLTDYSHGQNSDTLPNSINTNFTNINEENSIPHQSYTNDDDIEMKDCTEIVLTFEGNENLDYVANNTQNIQPFHHNGHEQIINARTNFNLSHNPLLRISSLQFTAVADICLENQNAPHDIHLMDNLYEVAADMRSSMDLDDFQIDDKMDIVSDFEENLDEIVSDMQNLKITDDCKVNQDYCAGDIEANFNEINESMRYLSISNGNEISNDNVRDSSHGTHIISENDIIDITNSLQQLAISNDENENICSGSEVESEGILSDIIEGINELSISENNGSNNTTEVISEY